MKIKFKFYEHFKRKILLFLTKYIFLKKMAKRTNAHELWERKEEKYYKAILNQISVSNQRISIRECLKLIRSEWRQEITILPRIVVVISTRCSLKCKYCGEFIPYFTDKVDISADEVIKELDCIIGQMAYIHTVEFIGGEPFLHNELDRILRRTLQWGNKIGQIELTTNAVVSIKPNVLSLLKNKQVLVLISVYPFNRSRVRKLERILKEQGICYQEIKTSCWSDFGAISKNTNSKEAIEKMYMKCIASRDCRTLYKGKLMYCSRGPYMLESGYNPGGLSIFKGEIRANMYKFYLNGANNSCRYCHYNHKPIPVAEQLLKSDIESMNFRKCEQQ